ncbi:MAG: hypothetical protein ACKO24_02815 [Leptolyngbyaceae cyanobacterium]
MLRGVGIRYGKNSIEYDKAGGSNRKRSRSRSTLNLEPTAAAPVVDRASVAVSNGSTNGNGKHAVLHERLLPMNGVNRLKQSVTA